MVAKKTRVWGIFGALITFITILLFLKVTHRKEWCTLAINAGDCDYYEEDEYCYCIDTFKYKNATGQDIYNSSQAQCQALNGMLVAAPDEKLTKWLAKRLFFMGVEKAVVALRKFSSQWFWLKSDGKNEAVDIMWRPDFPPNLEHKQGIITVQTVVTNMGNVSEIYTDYYTYYNYDHYKETDKNYKWYGFTTRDERFTLDSYYICKYDSASGLVSTKDTHDEDLHNPETTSLSPENSDPCYCSTDAKIVLIGLDDSQTFQSPRYPINYCSDSNCKWYVTAPVGLAIRVDWLVFSLEPDMDYVYIYDGHEHNSIILKECTSWKCGSQRSTENKMQIRFRSDHVTTDLGFRARVTAVEVDECYCSDTLIVELENLLESFSIYSPKYPNYYCPLHNCQWTFVAPEQYGLQMTFRNFDLETDHDYVYIFDGGLDMDKMLHSCSGSSCPDAITSGNKMHVTFLTDASMSTHAGFQGIVTVVQNFCLKEEMRSENRNITEEETYAKETLYSDVRSDGVIPIGANATVVCEDYAIIQGTNDTRVDSVLCESPKWNRDIGQCVMDVCYCSNSKSPEVLLENLYDYFTVQSPNFPKMYCSNHDCQWWFAAPFSYGLQISFKIFDIQLDQDYFYIYDGDKRVEKCTGTLCADYISINKLHLRFESQIQKSDLAGFQATVMALRNYCDKKEVEDHAKKVIWHKEREDGFIAVGGTANVICVNNTKIQGTEDKTMGVLTCEAPQWDRACVQTCKVEFEFPEALDDIIVCKTGDDKFAVSMIESGHNLSRVHYDFLNQKPISETQFFTCNGNVWSAGVNKYHTIKCNQGPKILIIGGDGTLRRMEVYYPTNPKLNRVLPLQTINDNWHATSGTISDGTVITCGSSPSAKCERYFPKQNLVIETEPMNAARDYTASAVLNGDLFVCGGIEFLNQYQTSSTCERYKIGVGWEYINQPMIKAVLNHGMAAYNGQLILIGGGDDLAMSIEGEGDQVQAYDPTEDKWSWFPSLNYGREYPTAAVMDGKLYVCGGYVAHFCYGCLYLYRNVCELYDEVNNQWVIADQMNQNRTRMVVMGNSIYAVGRHSVDVFNGKEWIMLEEQLHYGADGFTAVLIA